MESKNKFCPGTHRYNILKVYEYDNRYLYYLYCDKCGAKKRFAIRKPKGGPIDITQTYVNNKTTD
jgi:RNase P subunit RPR2